MKFSQVFVTVGTTNFDELIEKISSKNILEILESKGCKKLIVQYGNGKAYHATTDLIPTESYAYKSSLFEDIVSSDLIISHAGAGTSLEVLEANKLLLTVVNKHLMDNHQLELAEKFSAEGYSLYCVPETLEHTLERLDDATVNGLKKYPKSDCKKFGQYLKNILT